MIEIAHVNSMTHFESALTLRQRNENASGPASTWFPAARIPLYGGTVSRPEGCALHLRQSVMAASGAPDGGNSRKRGRDQAQPMMRHAVAALQSRETMQVSAKGGNQDPRVASGVPHSERSSMQNQPKSKQLSPAVREGGRFAARNAGVYSHFTKLVARTMPGADRSSRQGQLRCTPAGISADPVLARFWPRIVCRCMV